ncbi:hypothetical protein DL89DRAFT_320800 [Linderina pennispora]|uniref:Uncharacterized protein n=1 Tax=Linderina pennispora TaxID=61395 RepID=A0A1Y1WIU2_9FUNG|nr:uncharacterized protein DL89DRAFT_320800 [Linderina pennispora]ORX73136.1 hypothetical protein DL89DRAFT_320800 [Linderina pennispora]
MESSIRAQLSAIVASSKHGSVKEQHLQAAAQQLRNTHLALALHRTPPAALASAVLVTCKVRTDPAQLEITIHNHTFGHGTAGMRATTSTAQPDLPESSTFTFAMHGVDLLGEYAVELALVFDPPYALPKFAARPVVAMTQTLYIDALDSICPAPGGDTGEFSCNTDADRLLLALLVGNVSRQLECVVARGMAEFVLPIDRPRPVTLVCMWEHDHMCVRIRSACKIAYAVTIGTIARRLMALGSSSDGLQMLADKYSGPVLSAGDWQIRH